MCYGCQWAEIPIKPTIEEENKKKAQQYQNLLKTPEGILEDPFVLDGWISETEGIPLWPKVFIFDMTEYLLGQDDKELGIRLLRDYKVSKDNDIIIW